MRRNANAVRAGVVTLASVLILVLVAVTINVSFGLPFNLSLLPPGQDYTVKAAFTDANGVNRGADVVIAGHSVGQVTGVELSGKRAVVTMRVASRYAPLHQFSTARIRYSTLLAQKYVEIAPRDGGAELHSGATIQSENTLSPVDFDQFLSALDPDTRARLQTLIQQAGGGLQGQQQTINDLLSQLNGLSQESVAPLTTSELPAIGCRRATSNSATWSPAWATSPARWRKTTRRSPPSSPTWAMSWATSMPPWQATNRTCTRSSSRSIRSWSS